ncbi:MAG: hypothetical protein ACYTF7_00490 [Planctomycetota bacterium]|jgi:hypothetical protein
MASKRQIVLLNADAEGAMQPMGRKQEILAQLARFNIAMDGSDEGFSTAWGPGIRLEFPFADEKDPVNQIMVTLGEEDYAWPVLMRITRELHWRMMDPETGRTFG